MAESNTERAEQNTQNQEHLLDDLVDGCNWGQLASIKALRNEDVNYEEHLGYAKAIEQAGNILPALKVYSKFMMECERREERELGKRVKNCELPLEEGVKKLQNRHPETEYIGATHQEKAQMKREEQEVVD